MIKHQTNDYISTQLTYTTERTAGFHTINQRTVYVPYSIEANESGTYITESNKIGFTAGEDLVLGDPCFYDTTTDRVYKITADNRVYIGYILENKSITDLVSARFTGKE